MRPRASGRADLFVGSGRPRAFGRSKERRTGPRRIGDYRGAGVRLVAIVASGSSRIARALRKPFVLLASGSAGPMPRQWARASVVVA